MALAYLSVGELCPLMEKTLCLKRLQGHVDTTRPNPDRVSRKLPDATGGRPALPNSQAFPLYTDKRGGPAWRPLRMAKGVGFGSNQLVLTPDCRAGCGCFLSPTFLL